MRIIISGGGTGGHIFPALAIADALKKKSADIEILFVGAKGKMEMEKVPKAGYPIKGLWISGFQRKWSLKNLLFPIKLIFSLIKAGMILWRFKPSVVVGVGGYASGPILEMAYRLGIPAVIQEQNSYPGITNRLLAKKVVNICVAYDGLERFFPIEKIVKTGNPVRAEFTISDQKRTDAYAHFGFDPKRKTIGVFGGSLGAKTLNDAVKNACDLISSNKEEIQILWQMGGYYSAQYGNVNTTKLDNVKAVDFVYKMDLAYAMSDIVICRAGALTIAELSVVQKPTILVPSPNVSEDHQRKNAMSLVNKGAAVMVEDKNANKELIQMAINMLQDEEKLVELANNIAQFGKQNAASDIADIVLKNAKKSTI